MKITTNDIYVALKNVADDEDRQATECENRGNIEMRDTHIAIANAFMKLATEFYEQSL